MRTSRHGSAPWDAGDDELAKLLCRDDLLERDFLGHHIVRQGTGFVAYPMSLGIVNPQQFGPQWWMQQLAAGTCLVAANPYDLKSLIVRKCLARRRPVPKSLDFDTSNNNWDWSKTARRNFKRRRAALRCKFAILNAIRPISSNSPRGRTRQSCHELAERVNSLASEQAQLTESVAAARQECRQLAEVFQAARAGSL